MEYLKIRLSSNYTCFGETIELLNCLFEMISWRYTKKEGANEEQKTMMISERPRPRHINPTTEKIYLIIMHLFC